MNGHPYGLSLTSSDHLLVTIRNTKQLHEYTTDGRLVRSIQLDDSIDRPWHAVQLTTGQFVVSHGSVTQHRVLVVDTDGHIARSYGGPKGSAVGQLNGPISLAVDSQDNILVADCDNNKVRLLSAEMTHLGDLILTNHQMSYPYRLYLDEFNGLLYISEDVGGRLCVVKTN